MIKKSISFKDYSLAKNGNEDKSYSEIMDIAWKNSKERKVFVEDLITTAVLVTFIALLPTQLIPTPILSTSEILSLILGI